MIRIPVVMVKSKGYDTNQYLINIDNTVSMTTPTKI